MGFVFMSSVLENESVDNYISMLFLRTHIIIYRLIIIIYFSERGNNNILRKKTYLSLKLRFIVNYYNGNNQITKYT